MLHYQYFKRLSEEDQCGQTGVIGLFAQAVENIIKVARENVLQDIIAKIKRRKKIKNV